METFLLSVSVTTIRLMRFHYSFCAANIKLSPSKCDLLLEPLGKISILPANKPINGIVV